MDHLNTSSASFDEVDSHPATYARENGLSIDSQVNPFSFHLQFNHPLPHLTPDARLNGLTSDSSLHELRIPVFPCFKEQPLRVTREVTELLHKAVQRDDIHISAFNTPSQYETRVSITRLKLDPPLLKSDPDYDCRQLARIIHSRREAQLDPDTFPSEKLNAANDEALDFPESAYQFRDELDNTVYNEKIDVPKEVIYCLAKNLQDDWTEHDQRKMLEGETSLLKATRELTITPPLSPCERADNYFIPSDAVCQVPVASDPSTLLDYDLDAAEADVFYQDALQIESLSAQRLDIPTFSPLGDPPLLSPARLNLSSSKIEGPMTPINSTPTSFDPSVDMTGLAQSLDIDHVLETQKPNGSPTENSQDNHDLPSDTLWAALEENTINVMRDVEQERLESADALARVEVPTMDFSISESEWQRLPLDAKSHLQYVLDTYAGCEILKWHRDLNAERQRLYWSPFLREPETHFIESIDDNSSVEAALEPLVSTEVPTSADYVWKQPGWAILREPEEDDEGLEYTPFPIKKNLASLVKKRRLEMNISDLEQSGSSRAASPVDLIQIPTSIVPTSLPSYPKVQSELPNLLVDCNNASATSTLLSNYIDFHTAKRQKHERSSFFPISTQSEPEPEIMLTSKSDKARLEAGHPTVPNTKPQQSVATHAPNPTFNMSDAPTKIIKALTLNRGLFSRLEKLCPTAVIVERDFDRWNTLSWDRNSVSRSPVVSPLAAEADIAVSPATGIIVTTLLKVIQKPPPGHKGQAAIRERVSKAASRYERLIILVSEDNRTDETVRDLTPFESSAYAEFCGFVASLDMNAHVYYVGGGGDTLARWLAYSVAKHAPEADEVQELMIQDETSWELFLRRAGMNAYAAQAILGSLKAPDDIPEEETGLFGLPTFVRMTPAERLQAFRGLMGGERVLNKVNVVIESVWNTNPAW
ncbi:hypothetical protein F5X99DRAFT_300674 [Biscogniauxia marginata]|nr:hypothetical protein F5X99DRAFT_300674 [Biscogniauxia marginata]